MNTPIAHSLIGLLILAISTHPAPAALQDAPAPEAPAQRASEDFEIQLRGPLHEAFAVPTNLNPVQPPVIDRQPPETINELPPEYRPEGTNVIWIQGYWDYDPDLADFLWISGMWRDAPAGQRWVPGYWHKSDAGFQRIAGFWERADVSEIAYLPAPPPTLENGPSSPPPSGNHFWVPGCQESRNNEYLWRPGYWAPHQRDWVWTPSCYRWTPRGYLFNAGYWDYVVPSRGVPFAPVRFNGNVRANANVPFTPQIALLRSSQLLMHLFVDSSRNAYVFGDYYGAQYADRGIRPWYSAAGARAGYDPLLTYYSWRFGSEYPNRLAGWNTWFSAHADYRPALTLPQQLTFVRAHSALPQLQQAIVGSVLSDVAASSDSLLSFTRLSASQRTSIAADSNTQLGSIVSQRARLEADTQTGTDVGTAVPAALRLPIVESAVRVPRVGVDVPELPLDLRNVTPDLPNVATPRIPAPRVRVPAAGAPRVRVPGVGNPARGVPGGGIVPGAGGVLNGVGGGLPRVPGL